MRPPSFPRLRIGERAADRRPMPVRRRLLAVALGLGLTTSLAACAAEPQEAATSRVTTEPAPVAAAPARAAVSAACTAPPTCPPRAAGVPVHHRALDEHRGARDDHDGAGHRRERRLARRTMCRTAIDAEPLRDADPVALARDLRRAIEAGGSWTAESMRCRPDGRCHGSFSLLHGRERVGMTYVVRTRRGTACRVVTSISVTKPIPAWENTAPPTAGNVGCGPR
jgi:hypothetical protein